MVEYPLSLAVCDRWVHNLSFLLTSHASGENNRILHGRGALLKETLFKKIYYSHYVFTLADPDMCSLKWERLLVWFSKQITQNVTEKKPNETSCVIKYGGAQASSPHKGWGHHSEEIQKEIENSLVIWFLICSLPWQCKSNTVSEWNICRHKLYAQCNMDPVVNNMWVTLFPLKARWYI